MIYNITLKPVTPFFWGMEQVAELGNKRSYYLKSANYPQQTTILGMIRYQVLAQRGMLSIPDININEASRIIGDSSFSYGSINNFGAILGISPIQLQRGKHKFLLRDREFFNLSKDKDYPIRKAWIELNPIKENEFIQLVTNRKYFSQLIYWPNLNSTGSDYDYWIDKLEFKELLVKEESNLSEKDFPKDVHKTTDALFLDEVIQESEHVGIEKSWDSYILNNAYYKQFFKELQERTPILVNKNPVLYKKIHPQSNWEFSFKLEWDEKIGSDFDDTERLIIMGGEQSVFLMKISDEKNKKSLSEPDIIPILNDSEVYKLLLISDTYISDEQAFYSLPVLVNGQTVRFKNFISKVKSTKQYYVRGEHKYGFDQSSAAYLLKRGTMLYFEDNSSLLEALKLIKSEESFRKIGYNYYKIETEKYHKNDNNSKS